MTPEQTKSAYQRVCEQECEWCAKGSSRTQDYSGGFHHADMFTKYSWVACTAPSKDAFMERQVDQIAAMQAALAKAPHQGHCPVYKDKRICTRCGETWDNHYGTSCRSSHDLEQWTPGVPAPCNCYLSTLSDDIERGKELLGAVEASRYNADVATQAVEEMKRQAVEIEELRKGIRQVAVTIHHRHFTDNQSLLLKLLKLK